MRKRTVIAGVGIGLLGLLLGGWAGIAAIAETSPTAPGMSAEEKAAHLERARALEASAEAAHPGGKEALRDAQFAEFERKRAAWIDDFENSGRNARSLPRGHVMGSFAPPFSTLRSAVGAADLIVSGQVVATTFTSRGTFTQVRVERTIKGRPSDLVTVLQGGTVEPPLDFGPNGVIGDLETGELLLEGDTAIMLLQRASSAQPPGTYILQHYTGQYLVNAEGFLRAVQGNPFAEAANGESVDAFAARLRSHV